MIRSPALPSALKPAEIFWKRSSSAAPQHSVPSTALRTVHSDNVCLQGLFLDHCSSSQVHAGHHAFCRRMCPSQRSQAKAKCCQLQDADVEGFGFASFHERCGSVHFSFRQHQVNATRELNEKTQCFASHFWWCSSWALDEQQPRGGGIALRAGTWRL